MSNKGKSKRFSWKDKDPSTLQGVELKRYRDAERKARARQIRGGNKNPIRNICPPRIKKVSRPVQPAQEQANRNVPTRASLSRSSGTRLQSSSTLSECPTPGHSDNVTHADNDAFPEHSIVASHETIKIQSQAIADRLEQRFSDELHFKMNLKDEIEKLHETILEQRADTLDQHEEIIKPIEAEMRETLNECKQVLKRLKRMEAAQESSAKQSYQDVVDAIDKRQQQFHLSLLQSQKEFEERLLSKVNEAQSKRFDLDEFFSYFNRLRGQGFVPVIEASNPQGT